MVDESQLSSLVRSGITREMGYWGIILLGQVLWEGPFTVFWAGIIDRTKRRMLDELGTHSRFSASQLWMQQGLLPQFPAAVNFLLWWTLTSS